MQEINIKVVNNNDNFYAEACKDLAKEKQYSVGGEPAIANQFKCTKYFVCAIKEKELMGYIALKEGYYRDDDLCMVQFVVKNNNIEVENKLLDYVKTHSLGYYGVVVKVRKYYKEIESLYAGNGFRRARNFSHYYYRIESKSVDNNHLIEDEVELEKEN